jgi:TatA/E family protein of Tat protein translocase
MPFGLSVWELLIILLAVLLIFGAKRLPEMGRSLGKGMREFKEGVTGVEEKVTPSSPPAELPSAPSEPRPYESPESAPAEESERETVS